MVGQGPSDRLRAGQLLTCGVGVERRDLLGREAHSDHLHRLGPTPGTPSPAPLELLDVVPSLGLVHPLLDLLIRHLVFTHHAKIV